MPVEALEIVPSVCPACGDDSPRTRGVVMHDPYYGRHPAGLRRQTRVIECQYTCESCSHEFSTIDAWIDDSVEGPGSGRRDRPQRVRLDGLARFARIERLLSDQICDRAALVGAIEEYCDAVIHGWNWPPELRRRSRRINVRLATLNGFDLVGGSGAALQLAGDLLHFAQAAMRHAGSVPPGGVEEATLAAVETDTGRAARTSCGFAPANA